MFCIKNVCYFTHIPTYTVLSLKDKFVSFCLRLQPVTILTGFIAALTRLRELLLYAYPCTTMTMSSDLETVDVS